MAKYEEETTKQSVPRPEAYDANPRYMPDGSLDWYWYYQQQDILKAWWFAGLCIRCGIRPIVCRTAVCDDKECENTNRPKWNDERDECHYCGRKYGKSATGAGSFGGPTTPVNVQHCPDCCGRRPPPREQAAGQAPLF